MTDSFGLEARGLTARDIVPILDSISDGIFVDDASGYILWINKAGEELYRIAREEAVGKHISYLEELGIFSPSVSRLVLEKKEQVSIIHQNKDGKRLLITGIPVFDGEGKLDKIITTSHDITELIDLQNELEGMQTALQQGFHSQDKLLYGDIVVTSPQMLSVFHLTERLASVDSTILITGESGVGKGLIARLLHENGDRAGGPFVSINCGAIPENLLESELFGYESGAFTGSRKGGKKGLCETADGGTVFLDEIAELPLNLQVKILQLIQEKVIHRVGGLEPVSIDVRIVSATNKDLRKLVEQGQFREDLFYRLNVVPIHIPPLRDRPEDIIPLIRSFLHKSNQKLREVKTIDSNAMAMLLQYSWPGNVRELENIIERLVITTKDRVIRPENLPGFLFESARPPGEIAVQQKGDLKETLEEAERQILYDAKKKYGSTRQMARALGISQPSVVRKLAKYGL
ncbi:MAG: sigma 54-interacting transcriptional regulator [Bacillota bacterium]|nr:sigma 54-interacting transcriptional regulator [Bacillota bacterium]